MKKNRLNTALQLALSGALIGIHNAIIMDGAEELIASTAAIGVATDAAGVAIASVTARPHYLVIDDDCPDGYRRVVRWSNTHKVEVKLHSTAGSIAKGDLLQLHSDGTFKKDLATGGRVVCARAEEAKGADGELLAASLFAPEVTAS